MHSIIFCILTVILFFNCVSPYYQYQPCLSLSLNLILYLLCLSLIGFICSENCACLTAFICSIKCAYPIGFICSVNCACFIGYICSVNCACLTGIICSINCAFFTAASVLKSAITWDNVPFTYGRLFLKTR